MLETVCFILFAVLVGIYFATDGFDLGAGALSFFLRDTKDKAALAYALWPVWNGNEVWLLSAVVLLMAAFTPVYAAILSAFYVPVIALAAAIIFRGVSLEFYDKVTRPVLKDMLFLLFGIGSAFIAFAIGLVAGNVMHGIPPNAGSFMILPALIAPFPVSVGFLTLSYCMLHGAVFLAYKQHEKARAFFLPAALFFAASSLAVVITGASLISGASAKPFIIHCAAAALILGIGLVITFLTKHPRLSLFLSALLGISAVFCGASMMYPDLMRFTDGTAITMISASSGKSLSVIIAITLSGIPLAVLLNAVSYWVFRNAANKK